MEKIIRRGLKAKYHSKLWRLWFIQNVLLFIGFWLFLGNYIILSLAMMFEGTENFDLLLTIYEIDTWALYLIITASFCLDIIIIVSFTILFTYTSHKLLKKSKPFYLPALISLTGLFWIVISISWRIQYVLPFNINFGFGTYSLFIKHILDPGFNSLIHIQLFASGIMIFLFLLLQDLYFWKHNTTNFGRSIFGLSIVIGNATFLIIKNSGMHSFTFYLYFILLMWKLILTPIIGMIVSDLNVNKIKADQIDIYGFAEV